MATVRRNRATCTQKRNLSVGACRSKATGAPAGGEEEKPATEHLTGPGESPLLSWHQPRYVFSFSFRLLRGEVNSLVCEVLPDPPGTCCPGDPAAVMHQGEHQLEGEKSEGSLAFMLSAEQQGSPELILKGPASTRFRAGVGVRSLVQPMWWLPHSYQHVHQLWRGVACHRLPLESRAARLHLTVLILKHLHLSSQQSDGMTAK